MQMQGCSVYAAVCTSRGAPTKKNVWLFVATMLYLLRRRCSLRARQALPLTLETPVAVASHTTTLLCKSLLPVAVQAVFPEGTPGTAVDS
jgi:hypothetical protein